MNALYLQISQRPAKALGRNLVETFVAETSPEFSWLCAVLVQSSLSIIIE